MASWSPPPTIERQSGSRSVLAAWCAGSSTRRGYPETSGGAIPCAGHKRATVRSGLPRSLYLNEFHLEDQRGVRWNLGRMALLTVRQRRRYRQLADFAHLHPRDGLFPPVNDTFLAKRNRERRLAPARIKNLPVFQLTLVVNRGLLTGLELGAGAYLKSLV